MNWFNYYGLAAIVVIMIPNILCAIFDRSAFENTYENKPLSIAEQIGRYGCFVLMIFNIPYTYFGFWFPYALIVYLSVGGALLALYCLFWIVFRKNRSLARAISLSVTPTVLFLFCGIVASSIPLIVFSAVFGIGHIALSCKNALHVDRT